MSSEQTTDDAASPDDIAIDRFACAMSNKMQRSRGKGRSGWQACPENVLWTMLRDHVEKRDPVDVACLAMMIHQNRAAKRSG